MKKYPFSKLFKSLGVVALGICVGASPALKNSLLVKFIVAITGG